MLFNKAFKPTEKGLQNIKNVMNGQYLKPLNSNYVKLKDYNGEEKYFIKFKVSVKKISAMSEEIDSAVGQLSSAIQNMAASAQKSYEKAEVIEKSIDETVKAVEQVSKKAQSQAELAEKLNEMVIKLMFCNNLFVANL